MMKTLKATCCLLILFICFKSNAQNLNVTFLADTKNDKIGTICNKNISEISTLLDSTFLSTGQKVKKETLNLGDLSKGDLLKQFADKSVNKNEDVFIFYFSGYIRYDKSDFPFIKLKNDSNWVDSKLLFDILKKNKGLNILVVDGFTANCSADYKIQKNLSFKKAFSKIQFPKLFNNYTGNIFITVKPGKCNIIVNSTQSLFTYNLFETVCLDTISNDKKSWPVFLKKLENRQKQLLLNSKLPSPSLFYSTKLQVRNKTVKPPNPPIIIKDTTKIIPVKNIVAGVKISAFLGDTMTKIIQNADSVSCSIIITKTDSSGGKGSAYTYDVPYYFGRLSSELQSVLKFIILSDETYIEDSVVVKHQFEPLLTFAFNYKKQNVLILYSPASRTFGFGYKGALMKKQFKKTDNIDKFFVEIEKFAKNILK